MSSYHKFILEKDTKIVNYEGRGHRWYFNPDETKGAETILVHVIIKKGDGHSFHRHPEMNETLYVLKGTAEQWVEKERKILQKGDAVYIDPNVVHATFNVGDDDLEFLAVLAPGDGWKAGTIDESMNLPYSQYRNT
jgi:quercetin dioxygenase-like cupin family protein